MADMKPLERGVVLGQQLLEQGEITPKAAAEMTGCSVWTARRDLNAIARVVPLRRDDDGVWRLMNHTKP